MSALTPMLLVQSDLPKVRPDHLTHEKRAIFEDGVPGIGLGLETAVGHAFPLRD